MGRNQNFGKSMRKLITLSLVALGACGGITGSESTNNAQRGRNPETAVASMLPSEPRLAASSPAALKAVQTAQRYFDLIAQRQFIEASEMWKRPAAQAGSWAGEFEKAMARYERYAGTAGDPTDIVERDGKQYILVASKVHVRRSDLSGDQQLTGPLMMSRSKPDPTAENATDWTIWGSDLRARSAE
jgi:hypothetical protein